MATASMMDESFNMSIDLTAALSDEHLNDPDVSASIKKKEKQHHANETTTMTTTKEKRGSYELSALVHAVAAANTWRRRSSVTRGAERGGGYFNRRRGSDRGMMTTRMLGGVGGGHGWESQLCSIGEDGDADRDPNVSSTAGAAAVVAPRLSGGRIISSMDDSFVSWESSAAAAAAAATSSVSTTEQREEQRSRSSFSTPSRPSVTMAMPSRRSLLYISRQPSVARRSSVARLAASAASRLQELEAFLSLEDSQAHLFRGSGHGDNDDHDFMYDDEDDGDFIGGYDSMREELDLLSQIERGARGMDVLEELWASGAVDVWRNLEEEEEEGKEEKRENKMEEGERGEGGCGGDADGGGGGVGGKYDRSDLDRRGDYNTTASPSKREMESSLPSLPSSSSDGGGGRRRTSSPSFAAAASSSYILPSSSTSRISNDDRWHKGSKDRPLASNEEKDRKGEEGTAAVAAKEKTVGAEAAAKTTTKAVSAATLAGALSVASRRSSAALDLAGLEDFTAKLEAMWLGEIAELDLEGGGNEKKVEVANEEEEEEKNKKKDREGSGVLLFENDEDIEDVADLAEVGDGGGKVQETALSEGRVVVVVDSICAGEDKGEEKEDEKSTEERAKDVFGGIEEGTIDGAVGAETKGGGADERAGASLPDDDDEDVDKDRHKEGAGGEADGKEKYSSDASRPAERDTNATSRSSDGAIPSTYEQKHKGEVGGSGADGGGLAEESDDEVEAPPSPALTQSSTFTISSSSPEAKEALSPSYSLAPVPPIFIHKSASSRWASPSLSSSSSKEDAAAAAEESEAKAEAVAAKNTKETRKKVETGETKKCYAWLDDSAMIRSILRFARRVAWMLYGRKVFRPRKTTMISRIQEDNNDDDDNDGSHAEGEEENCRTTNGGEGTAQGAAILRLSLAATFVRLLQAAEAMGARGADGGGGGGVGGVGGGGATVGWIWMAVAAVASSASVAALIERALPRYVGWEDVHVGAVVVLFGWAAERLAAVIR